MTNKCGVLMKFFEKETYRNDFVNGKLYTNSLEHYRKNKEDSSPGRSDESEGIGVLEGKLFTSEGSLPIEVKVNLEYNGISNSHIFCMAIVEEEWLEQVGENQVKVIIPEEVINLFREEYGEYVCLIPIKPFLKQLDQLAQLEQYKSIRYGKVKYSNLYENELERMIQANDNTIVFNKDFSYANEHEFRVVFDELQDAEPRFIDVNSPIEIFDEVIKIDDLIKFFRTKSF